jgi:hypothetical protein
MMEEAARRALLDSLVNYDSAIAPSISLGHDASVRSDGPLPEIPPQCVTDRRERAIAP